MALQTTTTIKIGETIIKNFSRLEVKQKIHDHHTFSIEVRQDILVDEFQSAMPLSTRLAGQKISIEIKAIPDLDDLIAVADPKDYIMQFLGIITKIEIKKSRFRDMEETIVLRGCSTSIVLDNGPECNSFIKMPINDIVNKVKEGYDIDLRINSLLNNNMLAYTVQYNESDFDFLNRLAKRNGKWFYHNGLKLIFGDVGGSVNPKLIYGANMHNFSYGIKLVPTQLKIIENDNRAGEYSSDKTLAHRKVYDGFHQNFIDKSNQVFSKETVLQLNQNPAGGYGRTVLEEYTKNRMLCIMSKMAQVKASSEVPGVALGSNVYITGVDKQLETSYTITKITHTCDDGGGYENHFTAINFNGSVFSPKTDPDLVPHCQSQTAVVTANADPDGLSAIKVQMPWQEAKSQATPYIPLLQKYGGNERGSHIIPEIGDTVFVDFQGGNAELPIVTGIMTSTKEKSGYSTPNNDIKAVMHSRSGNRIITDDATGDITIESQKGQTVAVIHGDGNIRFKAPKNIEFEAGEDIIMNAGRDIKADAKQNIEIEAGNNISQEAANDIFISANGDIVEKGDNKTESITHNYTRSSAESTQFANEVKIFSSEENMLLESSQKTVEINSQEKSNLF